MQDTAPDSLASGSESAEQPSSSLPQHQPNSQISSSVLPVSEPLPNVSLPVAVLPALEASAIPDKKQFSASTWQANLRMALSLGKTSCLLNVFQNADPIPLTGSRSSYEAIMKRLDERKYSNPAGFAKDMYSFCDSVRSAFPDPADHRHKATIELDRGLKHFCEPPVTRTVQ